MHLTNYSVNKYNVDYEISNSKIDGEKTGSKRSLKFLFEYLRSHNHDSAALWRDIQVRLTKTSFNENRSFPFRILSSKRSFSLNLIYFLPIE